MSPAARRARRTLAAACAAAMLAGACGGDDSSSPSAPTPTPTPSPSPGGTPSATTTITITANGVSPQSVTVAPGSRVTFVNNDTRNHEMNSDPHPSHTDCPAINAVSFLAPGQSKQTDPLTSVRTCGFHDHNQPSAASLQGSIRVQ